MATRTWDHGAGTAFWADAANWSADTKPTSSDAAVFDGTSTADCTINSNEVCGSLTGDGGSYSGTLTIASGKTLTINGDCKPPHANNFVMVGGAIVLAGAAGNLGTVSDGTATSANMGTVSVTTTTLTADNSGFLGVDVTNQVGSTITCDSEFNFVRGSLNSPGKMRNKGTVAGLGTCVFGSAAQLLEQSGTFAIKLGLYRNVAAASVCPGTYTGDVWIYALAADSDPQYKFVWSAGTYNLTSSNLFGCISDSGGIDPVEYAVFDSTNACVLNVAAVNVNFKYLSNWITGAGRMVFSGCATFTSSQNSVMLEAMEFTGGSPVITTYDLIAVSLKVSGGTFSGGTKNVTLRDDWVYSGSTANFTAAGFAGSLWTVGGSVRLKGTVGNVLNLNPNSAWTLAIPTLANIAGSPYTARVDYANIKNLTVTGGTLYAVNCTDQGGNTGVTFGSSPPASNATLARFAATSGAHNLQAFLSGSALTFLQDGAAFGYALTTTVNQSTPKWGLVSYYDGTYQNVPLDNFNHPNPSAAPAAPTGFTVTPGTLTGSGTRNTAAWTVTPGATAYSLERRVTTVDPYVEKYNGAAPTYLDELLTGTFDYRVRASNGVGYGAYSAVQTVVDPVPPYFQDTFTDTDDTPLYSVTPPVHAPNVGAAWATVTGTLWIENNRCMNHTTSNGDNYADAGVADCTIQWDYRLASGTDTDYVAFFFRMASGASRWAVYMFGGTGTYINKDGGYIGGSRSASPGGTAVHTVRLVLAGASLTFFLDGVQQFQYTMDGTNQTATKFGMLISGSQANGNYMDNLIITA